MKQTSEPIVFFGSGPVAARSLELLAKNFRIEAVITKPRPAHHKGDVPVLRLVEKLQLPLYTVEHRQDLDNLVGRHSFKSRLAVLIDFGIIVSQRVIDHFPLGILNSHFSILPEWRGADPITFAILSGQKTTGVSLMLLTAGMDEGPILGTTTFEIPRQTTTPELTEALINQSNRALQDVIPSYLSGDAKPTPQNEVAKKLGRSQTPTYSRKLTKEDGILNWHKPAQQLEREVRAYREWPKSRAVLGTLEVVITAAHAIPASGPAGKRDILDKLPAVHCSEGTLVIDRLKPVGKKEMTGEAFLAGYKKAFLN